MTDKYRKFVFEYLIDGNASRAYVAAGYSSVTPDKNAYKLLQRKEIQEAIKAEQAKTEEKLEITRESILLDLQRIQKQCETTNPQASLKSVELQVKMLGFLAPIKNETKISGDVQLKDLLKFDE